MTRKAPIWRLLLAGCVCVGSTTTIAAPPVTRPATPTMRLHVHAYTAADVGRQVGFALGCPVALCVDEPTPDMCQFDSPALPFADALVAYLTRAGLTCDNAEVGLRCVPGVPLQTVRAGDAAQMVLHRVRSTARQVTGGAVPRYGYDVIGTVIANPAQQWVGLSSVVRPDLVEVDGTVLSTDADALDDNALVDPTLPDDAVDLPAALGGGRNGWPVHLVFPTTAPAGRLTHYQGRLRAWQMVEEVTADVTADDIAHGRTVHGRGVTAHVTGPDADGDLCIALAGPAIERYRDRMWARAVTGFVRTLDAGGFYVETKNFGVEYDTAAATLTLRLRPVETFQSFFVRLATITVRVPTKVRCVELPIDLRDLDLTVK